MLKDISKIKIQGASFNTMTEFSLFTPNAKAVLLYGRNGTGKSTIARAFRKAKGVNITNIQTALILDNKGKEIDLTDEEKSHIYVFDEDFVIQNVRVQDDGLGAIVMLGKQAELNDQIEKATEAFKTAEEMLKEKKAIYDDYNNLSPNSPRFYISKMKKTLQKHGWAERKGKLNGNKINVGVKDDTFKQFVYLSPQNTKNELEEQYHQELEHLETAQNGTAKILDTVPSISDVYVTFDVKRANNLLQHHIEKPELSEREQYLLNLVHNGFGNDLQETAREFKSVELNVCPKCHQTLSEQYKNDLILSIQKVLSNEIEEHQKALKEYMLNEITIKISPFQELISYQYCIDLISRINNAITHNNRLLLSKISNPYLQINTPLVSIADDVSLLRNRLLMLENERHEHNTSVTNINPIIEKLNRIVDEIAYYDVIDDFNLYTIRKQQYESALNYYSVAEKNYINKRKELENLIAQRKNVNIAIDLINEGLRYIFFDDNRIQIHVDGDLYRVTSKGQSIKPTELSVGERNIIGLCYFFVNMLESKNDETGYSDEYLVVIDDPISSFDFENKVGIISYLKYELSKFLLGNNNTKIFVTTHDLLAANDVGKIFKEIASNYQIRFHIERKKDAFFKEFFLYKTLINRELQDFAPRDRNEYLRLMTDVYNYANGQESSLGLYMGNILRQLLEAFSTFEYRKGIDEVSLDDKILGLMDNIKHRNYFRNLMYRLVLHGGSHREEQVKCMRVDFFSLISESEKRRTAKDILCFMKLLNPSHIIAYLGEEGGHTIDIWCNEILFS